MVSQALKVNEYCKVWKFYNNSLKNLENLEKIERKNFNYTKENSRRFTEFTLDLE